MYFVQCRKDFACAVLFMPESFYTVKGNYDYEAIATLSYIFTNFLRLLFVVRPLVRTVKYHRIFRLFDYCCATATNRPCWTWWCAFDPYNSSNIMHTLNRNCEVRIIHFNILYSSRNMYMHIQSGLFQFRINAESRGATTFFALYWNLMFVHSKRKLPEKPDFPRTKTDIL